MSEFEYENNDEVFNILTRKVGTVLSVKGAGPTDERRRPRPR